MNKIDFVMGSCFFGKKENEKNYKKYKINVRRNERKRKRNRVGSTHGINVL